MTNATKTLGAIFVALLAFTAFKSVFSNTRTSRAFSAEIIQFDSAKVNRVDVYTTANGNISLTKENGSWFLMGEDGTTKYEVEENAVVDGLIQLGDLKLKAVATRDENKYTRYQADSTGTIVELYNGDRKVAGITIGHFQFVSQQEFNTYVKPHDAPEVYSVEGFLSSYFSKNRDGWRRKKLWDFSRDDIQQVDFSYPSDSSYSIRKTLEGSWVSGSDSLSTNKVNSFLSSLAGLRANSFLDALQPNLLPPPVYSVRFSLSNGSQKSLNLTPLSEGGDFQASASEFPYVVKINKSTVENSILKPRSAMFD